MVHTVRTIDKENDEDGRTNNARPKYSYKYGEPKRRHNFSLTNKTLCFLEGFRKKHKIDTISDLLEKIALGEFFIVDKKAYEKIKAKA